MNEDELRSFPAPLWQAKASPLHSLCWLLRSTPKRSNEPQGKTARAGCGRFGWREDPIAQRSYGKWKSLHQTRNNTNPVFHKEKRLPEFLHMVFPTIYVVKPHWWVGIWVARQKKWKSKPLDPLTPWKSIFLLQVNGENASANRPQKNAKRYQANTSNRPQTKSAVPDCRALVQVRVTKTHGLQNHLDNLDL